MILRQEYFHRKVKPLKHFLFLSLLLFALPVSGHDCGCSDGKIDSFVIPPLSLDQQGKTSTPKPIALSHKEFELMWAHIDATQSEQRSRCQKIVDQGDPFLRAIQFYRSNKPTASKLDLPATFEEYIESDRYKQERAKYQDALFIYSKLTLPPYEPLKCDSP